MATDNKQNDQKEARKNPGVSNYVIIPVALAATLCGWITSPYGEALIKEVEAHWLHVVYLVYPAFTVLGGGSMLKDQQELGKQLLGRLQPLG